MSANGQLGPGELSPAAGGVVGPFAGSGQLASNGPAAAWNALNQVAVAKHGAHLTSNGPSSLYRNLTMQQYFWHLYQTGQGNLAAYPGTSNHGLGWASDTPPYVWAIMRAEPQYGWGPCSDAPSEAWHRKWCGNWHGSDPGPGGGHGHPRYPTLKHGAHGGAVKRAQKHLRKWNVGLVRPAVDGSFGKTTRSAVWQFQAVHGLKPDGVIGEHTWARLRLVDHFLNDERAWLNHLRLLSYRAKHGHKPTPDEKRTIKRIRALSAKRASSIRKIAKQHGWKGNYRLVRYKQLVHAAGRSH